jgi:hypothetical protein
MTLTHRFTGIAQAIEPVISSVSTIRRVKNMTSNKFGRVFVPVFVIAALVLSLFSIAPVWRKKTTGPRPMSRSRKNGSKISSLKMGAFIMFSPGRHLQDVADRFGTTVEDLRDANDDIVEDVDDDVEYVFMLDNQS